MRKIIKNFTLFFLSLYFTSLLIGENLVFTRQWRTMLLAALFFTLCNLLVKPILKFLLFPLNLLTLGATSLLANLATIFILTLSLGEIKITPFATPEIHLFSLTVPSFFLTGYWPLLAFSFIILTIYRLLSWLLK